MKRFFRTLAIVLCLITVPILLNTNIVSAEISDYDDDNWLYDDDEYWDDEDNYNYDETYLCLYNS